MKLNLYIQHVKLAFLLKKLNINYVNQYQFYLLNKLIKLQKILKFYLKLLFLNDILVQLKIFSLSLTLFELLFVEVNLKNKVKFYKIKIKIQKYLIHLYYFEKLVNQLKHLKYVFLKTIFLICITYLLFQNLILIHLIHFLFFFDIFFHIIIF